MEREEEAREEPTGAAEPDLSQPSAEEFGAIARELPEIEATLGMEAEARRAA